MEYISMEEDFIRIVGQLLSKHFKSSVTTGISSGGHGLTIAKTGTMVLFTSDELFEYENPETAAKEIIKQLSENR